MRQLNNNELFTSLRTSHTVTVSIMYIVYYENIYYKCFVPNHLVSVFFLHTVSSPLNSLETPFPTHCPVESREPGFESNLLPFSKFVHFRSLHDVSVHSAV